jgi:hypothetical protein
VVFHVPKKGRVRTLHGQATILMHSDWRAEGPRGFLFGAGTPQPSLDRGLRALRGLHVRSVSIAGELPELVVGLDRGVRLRSFSAWSGPNWDFALDDRKLFPRAPRWSGIGQSLHVGFDDEHGLYRIVCWRDGPPTPPRP